MGIGDGDWGLGIGDWAQSPIPNPQSPIPIFYILNIIFKLKILFNSKINKKYNLKKAQNGTTNHNPKR